MLSFPEIDPVALQLGPVAIRWYSLAYLAGIALGWAYVVRTLQNPVVWRGTACAVTPAAIGDFVLWATLGIILGGRFGYVLFYNFSYFAGHPLEIFKLWQGGMSFHGGMLGVILAIILFARKRQIPLGQLADLVACAAPIGLFFGRLANFINAELWGR
ncbi:MAG TPA: prolipoprotein diacylglyceryl transferase, partial [Alphaproteobacteria bacterium]|nr:prolipoprotein diacylglyceryl transferase [Alphaproteobacteria bacterium]